MLHYLLAAPACAILATAALGTLTGLTTAAERPSSAYIVNGTTAGPDGVIADGKTTPRVAHRAADGLFYTHALINGHRVRLLVDSGSSVIVLNAADADRTGANVARGRQRQVETAAGTTAMQLTTLRDVVVAGQRMRHINAAIVGPDLRVSLLGQSALSKLRSVEFSNDELRLN